MANRKYDTEALVGQLRKERRTSLILTGAGVAILLFLVMLYFVGGDDEEVPTVPTEHPAMAAQREAAARAEADRLNNPDSPPEKAEPEEAADPEKPEEEAQAAPEEPEEPAGPATVAITLSKRAPLWVDNKRVKAKRKKASLELEPGTHTLRTKAGRRKIEHKLEVKGGEKLSVFFDLKKKKVVTKEE